MKPFSRRPSAYLPKDVWATVNKFEQVCWGRGSQGNTFGKILGVEGAGPGPGGPHVIGVWEAERFHVTFSMGKSNRQSDMTENITFPQTTYVVGNKKNF